jgi:hypothetical protein
LVDHACFCSSLNSRQAATRRWVCGVASFRPDPALPDSFAVVWHGWPGLARQYGQTTRAAMAFVERPGVVMMTAGP